MHYFSIFSTKIKKTRVNFSRVWTKKNKFLRKFEKIFKRILKKIAKNPLFLAYSLKTFTNHALIFRLFGRKTQIVGKF